MSTTPRRSRTPGRAVAALLGAVGLATLGIVGGTGPAAAEPTTGTLRVTVTQADGSPARGLVEAYPSGDQPVASATLDQTGTATLDLPARDYVVRLVPAYDDSAGPEPHLAQWVPGARAQSAAGWYDVFAGETTEVTDRLIDPASLTVTVRDLGDGSPLNGVCVRIPPSGFCTDGSVVVVPRVLPGPTITVVDRAGRYLPHDESVGLRPGGSATLDVTLSLPSTITTRVVDARTGQPVAGACAGYTPAGKAALDDSTPYCSDGAGRITVPRIAGGAYRLFVAPPGESSYGAQWVGATGGTGDPTKARTITVGSGGTVEVPTVRLDQGGAIAGTVTSAATGGPLADGYVSTAWGTTATNTDEQGRYRLDGLGPYRWPLYFVPRDHARQWSGAVADVGRARLVRVRAGATSGYDAALALGTVLTGRITGADGQPRDADVTVYRADTGELLGRVYEAYDTYRLLVVGPQDVRIHWRHGRRDGNFGWYDGAPVFAQADVVRVPKRGSVTVDLAVD